MKSQSTVWSKSLLCCLMVVACCATAARAMMELLGTAAQVVLTWRCGRSGTTGQAYMMQVRSLHISWRVQIGS